MQSEQYRSFLAKLQARGMDVHTIEHISATVRRVAIYRPGKPAVYAIISHAIEPRDGFSIYYLSPTNKIDEDVSLIEASA